MADCEKMMQLCEESLDRTLTAEEQEALDRHLEECPECAAYLADLRFMTEALSGDQIEAPADLHEKIMAGVMTEVHSTVVQPHVPNRRMPVFTMLAAAAACVCLVMSGAAGDLMNAVNFQFAVKGGGAENATTSSAAADMAMDSAADDAASGYKMALGSGSDGAAAEAAPQDSVANDAAASGSAGAPESAEEYENADAGIAAYSVEGGDMTPALYSRNADGRSSAAVEPQVSAVAGTEAYAFCYLAEYGGELPEIGGKMISVDDNFAYYVVDNNLSQLEVLLDGLEKAGYSVGKYEELGLLVDPNAESGILIIRLSE